MATHVHYIKETGRFAHWSTIVDAYVAYNMTFEEVLREGAHRWGHDGADARRRRAEVARRNGGCQWGAQCGHVHPTPDICPTFNWHKAARLDTDEGAGRDGQKKDWGPHGWGCLCRGGN